MLCRYSYTSTSLIVIINVFCVKMGEKEAEMFLRYIFKNFLA